MKWKCRIFAAFFVLVAVFVATTPAIAEEKTKEYHESWTAGGVQTLAIENKFGDIKIRNNGGNEVTIDVVITVEAPNEAKANELLEKIYVDFDQSGGTIKAETHIAEDFKSRQEFSIDYEIYIPSDKNLDIFNKYGNTALGVLNANGEFNIQYGNFTATELNAPESGEMNINLEYGKADISSASDLNVTAKYSTLNFGTLDDLDLESKYAVVNINEGSSISAESKYDTFNFDEIGSVSGNTKYTHIVIGQLANTMKVDAEYGGIRIDEVNPDFQSINITNSYGQISLGMDNANYLLDATCDYCGVDYPEDNFVGDRMSENHTSKVNGKVGTGTGGSVRLNSRYGQIKLKD